MNLAGRTERLRGRGLGVLLAAALLLVMCSQPWEPGSGPRVEVVVSSAAGDRLAGKPVLSFGPHRDPEGRPLFALDDSVRLQEIDGFGASFLEAGLVTLDTLPSRSDQDAVLRALFNPREGAGFSAMKTVIGATDFQSASQKWYTYDDVAGDVSLSHFSIERDLGPHGLVTYIKRAREAGGSFVLQAPMDYPPDWMLYDVHSNQDVDPKYDQTLADYYARYVQEYEKQGIDIDYLSPFNEPGNYTKISMAHIGALIRDYVGPTFDRENLSTQIQLSEVGSRQAAAAQYPPVLDDPNVRAYVSVVPYHGYDDRNAFDRIASLHARYPDLPLWMTEVCCQFTQSEGLSFESGDAWVNTIISDLEAGASAWIYWNAILDQEGGPWLVSKIHNDGDPNAQESVVVIDQTTHAVTYTGLYYYLAHFSKFVRPGAVRIETKATAPRGLRAISFQNADGTVVSELVNSRKQAVTVQVDWSGQSLAVTLPAVSITTLRWPGRASPSPSASPSPGEDEG